MATLTPVTTAPQGTNTTPTLASVGGDKVPPGTVILVQNADAAARTVSIAVPGNTKYGLANPDITAVSLAAGDIWTFGPLPQDLADPIDGLVAITFPGGVTNLKIRAFVVPQ